MIDSLFDFPCSDTYRRGADYYQTGDPYCDELGDLPQRPNTQLHWALATIEAQKRELARLRERLGQFVLRTPSIMQNLEKAPTPAPRKESTHTPKRSAKFSGIDT